MNDRALPLTEGRVDVWLADPEQITSQAVLTEYEGLLDDDERQQYGRFYFAVDRHLYLVAHALVRTALSRYAPIDPHQWRFVRNEHGRPEIEAAAGDPPLRFNLSHTKGLAACAITPSADIGVDVEDIQRLDEPMKLAERWFAPREVEQLQAAAPSQQREMVYQFWTLKESYLKARGTGLSLPLKDFAFQLQQPGKIGVDFKSSLNDDPVAWQFAFCRPTPRHMLSIAVRTGDKADFRIEQHKLPDAVQ